MDMKNVEIKAAIKNMDNLNKIIKDMGLEAKLIKQHDIFFNSTTGRLKMRKFEDNTGELIFYDRTDTEGPKLSSYDKLNQLHPIYLQTIYKLNLLEKDFNDLSTILKRSLGILGEVIKRRQLYLLEQTRIHVDEVEGLGNFIELEVVLKPDQSVEEGQSIAETIMKKLEIKSEDLISCAYMDLIRKKNEN